MLTPTTTVTPQINNTSNKLLTSLNDSLTIQKEQHLYSPEFREEEETCYQYFDKWSPLEQIDFVENLLRRMCHFQHGHINSFLKPMLQRDFISSLPGWYCFLFCLS